MIRAKKSLGQHFLSDPHYTRRIAESSLEADTGNHLEIGPGTGVLTEYLYAGADHLTVIETDERLLEDLSRRFPKLEVIHADILNFDWNKLSRLNPLAVTGNLPYYITSPILFQILEARHILEQAVVMIQREVADRIVSQPSTKAYGILSVQFQLFFNVERLCNVPRTVFKPVPNVDSSVLKLIPKTGKLSHVPEHTLRRLIRDAFARRRKTLQNNLKGNYDIERIPEQWRGRRAESFTPQEFLKLAGYVFDTPSP